MKSISKILMVITVLLSSINGFAKVNPVQKTSLNIPQLTTVFDNYLSIKDALVGSDAGNTATKAKDMAAAINVLDMSKIYGKEYNVWTKVMKDLTRDVDKISKSKSIQNQREAFRLLSENMYELAKVSRLAIPIHYQSCPMANDGKGANWLSKDTVIKNPYYGDKMLTCGSVVGTIK